MRRRQEGRLGERIKEGGRERGGKGKRDLGEKIGGKGEKKDRKSRRERRGRVNNCIQNDTINK